MFLLVDNYDSFTYNLWHFLGELGAEVKVYRNDKIRTNELLALKPSALIISPGPCDPDKAGICLELIAKAPVDLPIFGVCLGHQCIAQAFGSKIVQSPEPMHGKLSRINNSGLGIFDNIPTEFMATRYHSLLVEQNSLPECLEVNAWSDDGLIMGIHHKTRPIFGVQFHPESIASDHGYSLLANFLRLSGIKTRSIYSISQLEKNLRKSK